MKVVCINNGYGVYKGVLTVGKTYVVENTALDPGGYYYDVLVSDRGSRIGGISKSYFRLEEKLIFPFFAKCINVSGYTSLSVLVVGEIYEIVGEVVVHIGSPTVPQNPPSPLGPIGSSFLAWHFIAADGRRLVRSDCFERIVSSLKSAALVSSEEWRLFQHNVPGECPCGIPRKDCKFHNG
jgi:hypothetical protein